MNKNLFKSYICQGKQINLRYDKKINSYIIEIDGKPVRTFSVMTSIKVMEDYALKLLTKLTD